MGGSTPDYQDEPLFVLRPQRLSDPEVTSPDFEPTNCGDDASHISEFLSEQVNPSSPALPSLVVIHLYSNMNDHPSLRKLVWITSPHSWIKPCHLFARFFNQVLLKHYFDFLHLEFPPF